MNLPDLSPSMLWAFTAMAFVYGTGMTLTVAILRSFICRLRADP